MDIEIPFSNWEKEFPKGGMNAYLCVVKQDPIELTALHFAEDLDDLDSFKAVLLKTKEGRLYFLRRHNHNSYPGTEISTITGETDLQGCLKEILSLLGLTMADVNWTPDTIKC